MAREVRPLFFSSKTGGEMAHSESLTWKWNMEDHFPSETGGAIYFHGTLPPGYHDFLVRLPGTIGCVWSGVHQRWVSSFISFGGPK